jgi:hypothetical protein
MIGFDDDSNACVNDLLNPDQSPEVIFERATTDAQLWNDLLCCSGGALEIPEWRITSLTMGFCCRGSGTSNSPIVISLRFGFKKDQNHSDIPRVSTPYAARKTLGCYKSPSDNFKKSIAHIVATAKAKSDTILHNSITAKSAHRYYYSVFLPSVTYGFPTNRN